MKVSDTKIPEIKIIEPIIFADKRGFFFESFNHKNFEKAVGYSVYFVQDNHSWSQKGVVRGLHYQLPPYAPGKLVRVVQGKVFDIAVDLRKSSQTFGQWVGEILSADNRKQLWIKEGFAHGFFTLSDIADVLYKSTQYYAPVYERSIRRDDPKICINWPRCIDLIVSQKDSAATEFRKEKVFD